MQGTNNWFDGVPKLVTDANCESLDLILLPSTLRFQSSKNGTNTRRYQGVAFDRNLSRLGHGKGFYDRFISSYVSSGHPRPLLGMCS